MAKATKSETLSLPKESEQLQKLHGMAVFATVEFPPLFPGLGSETVVGFVTKRDDVSVSFDFSYYGAHLFSRTLVKTASGGFKWQTSH